MVQCVYQPLRHLSAVVPKNRKKNFELTGGILSVTDASASAKSSSKAWFQWKVQRKRFSHVWSWFQPSSLSDVILTSMFCSVLLSIGNSFKIFSCSSSAFGMFPDGGETKWKFGAVVFHLLEFLRNSISAKIILSQHGAFNTTLPILRYSCSFA